MAKVNIIDLKQRVNERRNKRYSVYCDALGGELEVKKLPLREVTAIMDRYDVNSSVSEICSIAQELIYKSCELFQDKELAKMFGNIDKDYEIVGEVLGGDLDEVNRIGEEILALYADTSNGYPN